MIGISCCLDEETQRMWISRPYIDALTFAGALPILIPLYISQEQLKQMLHFCSGILLSGGGDIDPLHFGEEPQPSCGEICPPRDQQELILASFALNRKIPLLGICRGAQVINVASGGSVCQDLTEKIEKPLKHFQSAPRSYPTHHINILVGSQLKKIIGSELIAVNSFHHQMIGRLGAGFCVSAYAPDGVIEAIEHQDETVFALGVQYHPETLWKVNNGSRAIFFQFVQKAKEYQNVEMSKNLIDNQTIKDRAGI